MKLTLTRTFPLLYSPVRGGTNEVEGSDFDGFRENFLECGGRAVSFDGAQSAPCASKDLCKLRKLLGIVRQTGS